MARSCLPRVCRHLSCNIGNCCYCRTRWPRCCALVLLGSHQKGSGVSCSPGRHAFPLPLLDDPYLHPGRLLNDIIKNVEPVCSNSQHAVRTTTHCLSPFLFCEVEGSRTYKFMTCVSCISTSIDQASQGCTKSWPLARFGSIAVFSQPSTTIISQNLRIARCNQCSKEQRWIRGEDRGSQAT